jgi:hypothetical protein
VFRAAQETENCVTHLLAQHGETPTFGQYVSSDPILTLRGSVRRTAEKIFQRQIGDLQQRLIEQARQQLGRRRCQDACCDMERIGTDAGVTLVCQVYAPAASAPLIPAGARGWRSRL